MTQTPGLAAGVPATPRRWTLMRAIGFLSVTLFLTTEIVAVCGAGMWAVSGLLGLGTIGVAASAVLFGLPALYAVFKCAQLALIAETDPAND